MADFTIIVNKASFAVYIDTPSKKGVILEFRKRFDTYTYVYDYKTKRKVKRIDKNYSAGNPHQDEWIFNIRYIKDFMWMLKTYGYNKNDIEIVHEPLHKVKKLNLKFNYDKYELRDYQINATDQVVANKDKFSMLLDFQTGFGKSLMAVNSVCRINKAVAVLILPKYIEKWIEDFKIHTDIKDDDIIVVKGGKDLLSYMELAESGEYTSKVIIFSNRTISNYIRDYESCEDLDEFFYPISPGNLMEAFNIGVLMIDEAHQEFYSVFKASLYFKVDVILGMTATLVSDDKTKEVLYESVFPNEVRLSNLGFDRYIDLHEVRYRIAENKRLNVVGNMGYSHIAFEQQIMRNSRQFSAYIKMIKHYVKIGYLDRKKDGDKILIFASSIDMCTYLTNVMLEFCPNLTVSRYVENDDYDNVINSDVIISTIGSSGTAFDIPGLITTINTISVKSKTANIQALGRLRKKDGRIMKYYQLFSKDIKKQQEYHLYRLDILKPRIKQLFLEEYFVTI